MVVEILQMEIMSSLCSTFGPLSCNRLLMLGAKKAGGDGGRGCPSNHSTLALVFYCDMTLLMNVSLRRVASCGLLRFHSDSFPDRPVPSSVPVPSSETCIKQAIQ